MNDMSPKDWLDGARAVIREAQQSLRDASATISANESVIEAQNKLIANQVEIISELSGQKVKEREKAKVEALATIAIGKNPNYGQSVWLGFRESIIFAPTALLREFKEPLQATVGAILLLIVATLKWTFRRFSLLALGLMGRLSPKKAAT